MKSLDPYTVPFINDFLLVLRRMEERPIKLTKAEKRLSLTDMAELIPKFANQESVEEHKKYGWSIRLEHDIDFLEQARVIIEVSHLGRKERDKLFLSRQGKEFLHKLDPVEQYSRLVIYFWEHVNWGYFAYGSLSTMARKLQNDQGEIWRAIRDHGYEWCDFGEFCQALRKHFDLDRYKEKWEGADWLRFEVDLALFRQNLIRLGCVEVEREAGPRYLERIKRFRPTYLGLYVFECYLGCFNSSSGR